MDTTTNTVFDTPPTTSNAPSPTTRDRRRRWWLVALITVVALLLGVLARQADSSTDGDAGAAGTAGAAVTAPTVDPVPGGGETSAADPSNGLVGDDVAGDADATSGGAAGPGAFDPQAGGDGPPPPVELDPVGGDAANPCAELPADQGDLLVGPDPLLVPSGTLSDRIFVRNCGVATVDWTAATVPGVALADAGGSLPAGQLAELPFDIDAEAWEPGAVEFKIKVSEPGHNHYVDVHAFRPTIGSDMQASNELTAGEGVGGCSSQCITKAWLTPNFTTPNVGLEVRTTVPATIEVHLSTDPPVMNGDDDPEFPGAQPAAVSPQHVTEWSTVLQPLQPTTKYHIIVSATDEDGDVAHQVGSFTTLTPVDGPGSFKTEGPEPGCAHQCITKATVAPGDGLAPAHLSVTSHTPARFQLQVGTDAPVDQGGVPTIDDPELWENSGLEYTEAWEADLTGLAPGTTYHAVLQATDANGNTAHATGQFSTDTVDVRLVLHTIYITQDGDAAKVNAGELTFSWGTGDQFGAISEEKKLKAGEQFSFDVWDSQILVEDVTGYLPAVYVEVSERDWDAKAEFCSMGNAPAHEPGSSDDCDSKWNVATTGHLVNVQSLDALTDCAALGFGAAWSGLPCMLIESQDLDDDYPEFWTVVSYHVQ